MTLSIRPLAPKDREKWQELWIGYRTFYEMPVDIADIDILWSRLLTDGHDPHGLVACTGDGDTEAVIGIVHFLYHASTLSVADKCYLQDLFVHPAYRVGGAGRALIEAVYGAARDHGAAEVYWTTQHFNSIARVLYDRVGELTPFVKYRKLL